MVDDATEDSWVLPVSVNDSNKPTISKISPNSLEPWVEPDTTSTKPEGTSRDRRGSDRRKESEQVASAGHHEANKGSAIQDWTETSSSPESTPLTPSVHAVSEIEDHTSDLPTTIARGWPLFIAHNLDTLTDLQSIIEIVDGFEAVVHRIHFPLLLNETKRLMRMYDSKLVCLWTNLQDPIHCMALKEISVEEINDKFGRANTLPEWKRHLESDDGEQNPSRILKNYSDNDVKTLTREALKFVDVLLRKTREVDTWSKMIACAENATYDYLCAQNGYISAVARDEAANEDGNRERNGSTAEAAHEIEGNNGDRPVIESVNGTVSGTYI